MFAHCDACGRPADLNPYKGQWLCDDCMDFVDEDDFFDGDDDLAEDWAEEVETEKEGSI